MTDTFFSSNHRFRDNFEQGLEDLLKEEGPGVFILVLANATFDPQIYDRLKPALQQRFETLSDEYASALKKGQMLNDSADDLLVFLKLMVVGFENIQTTEIRNEEQWEIQFNHLRSLRPPRMTGEKVNGIYKNFNPDGFNFNKPFLKKEIFWKGFLLDRDVSLFYNKFPFANLHGLLVPEPRSNKPQFLEQSDHRYIWHITEELGNNIDGLSFAYNSYGAYASVNHLHFQMFIRDRSLPVGLPGWSHNGGTIAYPATCLRFDNANETGEMLDHLHAQEISYNLIYQPGTAFILPRQKQGEVENADWTAGFAWAEMAGCITTFGRQDFEQLSRNDIHHQLMALQHPV